VRTRNVGVLLFVVLLCIVGCTASPAVAQPTAELGMSNPATVYCIEQDGQWEIRTDADGGEYGMCIFQDGSECEEWAFFRGECKPAKSFGQD